MGRLKVISDHLEGSFDLPEKPWRIGRGNDCDIQLVNKSVSRHHCIITESGGQLRIEDLGSTYGTFINGAQISDARATFGDKVKLGRIVLVYEATAKASAPAVTAPAPAPVAEQPKPAVFSNPPPKFAPPALPPAQHPKLSDRGPVARFKTPPENFEAVEQPAPKKPAAAGVYNRLAGGHQRKAKAEKPDYEKEAEAWEKRSRALEEGEVGPDYAAEADDWEKVWGKQKKRRGFAFFGGGSAGGGMLMGIFGALPAKMRALVMVAVMAGIGGVGKVGYDKATAHILVPKKVAKKKSLLPTPNNKDAILEKALETFGKTIPDELKEKK